MASKSKTYFNNISPTKKNTISIIVSACKDKGITSQIFQAALLGIVSKESDFVPKGEGSAAKTSAARIRGIFGTKLKGYTDAQIDSIKLDEKKFFSIIYGDKYDNGPEPTKDGWTYRGRGFNQLTFKGNYKAIGKSISLDLVGQPELIEKLENAAKALVQFYISAFSKMPSELLNQYGINKKGDSIATMNGVPDVGTGVRALYQATAGSGKKEGGIPIALYLDKGGIIGGDGDIFFPNDHLGGFTKARNRAPLFYKMISGGLEPPSNTPPPVDKADPDPEEDKKPEQNQPNDGESKSQDEPTETADIVIPGLTNIFPPTIKVPPIEFSLKDESRKYKKEMAANLGWKPFIWYNGYQIADKDIKYFSLYNDGIFPMVTIIFSDTMNQMRDKAFPLDDTKIKIFLSSRTTNIRHILLEFKIKNFSINGQTYTVIGTLNVNGLHVKNYKAYSKKTSYLAIQDICKETEIGFNSNIKDSDDNMTWINTGLKVHDFIDDIMDSAYISDEAFAYGYIDYYYNFNYVDIEKELSRDNSEDKSIDTSGLSSNISGDDAKIYTLALTNDKGAKESDKFISEYKILNNSTNVSLNNGYLNISKFYDDTKKEFLVFDVDSITSDGSKTIIMKASPQDEQFYKENYTTTYVGKMDSDNSHKNFNYSHVHNSQNIEDLQKIGIKIKLPNPNFNIYRFQKIKLILTNESTTPGNNLNNDRISGDWFTTDIKFVYNEGSMYQEISLIKRELELSPDELDAEDTGSNTNPTNSPIEKTTNPTDLSSTDAPITGPTSSTPATQEPVADTSPPPPPGKYDLEYITGPEDKLKLLKDNSGKNRKLAIVDGQPVDESVANAFLQMRDAAKKDGITITINSGFRPAFGPNFKATTSKGKSVNITTQESLRRNKNNWKKSFIAKYKDDDDFVFNAPSSAYQPATAQPGKSNHGNGVALDLSTGSRVSFSKKLTNDGKVYVWMVNNSYKYGFIRAVNSEEWHFEYRPTEAKNGPYAKVAASNANLFYTDLGLDKIRLT